jgi:hypothetical protein
MSYAWESLSAAVRVLANSDTQRERLVHAYNAHLRRLTSRDIPAEIRAEFVRFEIEIRRCSVKEGHLPKCIHANVLDSEVAAMVHSILRMYDAVARYQPLPSAQADAALHLIQT